MIVKIKRQDSADEKSYYSEFRYMGSGRQTVAHILDELNYTDDLYNINDKHERKIVWDCSCLQKVCGSCAMVINGMPALACATFIDTDSCDCLLLEPLTKFPVICDLKVDRSIIFEHPLSSGLYDGKSGVPSAKEHEHMYMASKCLKCGLCLEVCPNYIKGEKFYGAAFANEAYLCYELTEDRKKDIKREYNKHFASHCSKSFACRDICPADIPTIASIGKMN